MAHKQVLFHSAAREKVLAGASALANAVAAEEKLASGDEKTGLQIPHRALSAPTRQIAENSSVDGSVVVAKMVESSGSVGLDAAKKEHVALVEAGILDPDKAVRIALKNAISAANVLLLTEVTMTEFPEPEPRMPAAPEMTM